MYHLYKNKYIHVFHIENISFEANYHVETFMLEVQKFCKNVESLHPIHPFETMHPLPFKIIPTSS